ncbi:hypothetical protein MJO29_008971 [Puccinia striiformis f. sp. tritici]|uniref:hypothetical protein n=1 Tax=Puccinia striiformis f. sp. tritici TaxID=168172 RepID=UPI002008B087|nr:hypothetical protein Pst134EA_017776 [Puccinia striiformis f. sp. tritici]KAH9461471.1 hypothetical protein Pst134EA_017776 [Puccinia striiformis f. sp. tritici]KAI7950297.1 hypothetical protein MJO29_008971 [Puccinia striiformis f. sp. tritici]
MDIDEDDEQVPPISRSELLMSPKSDQEYSYTFAVPLATIDKSERRSEKETIKRIERELSIRIEFEKTVPHFRGFGNGSCRIMSTELLAIYRALALIVALVRLSSPSRYCFWTHWLVPEDIVSTSKDINDIDDDGGKRSRRVSLGQVNSIDRRRSNSRNDDHSLLEYAQCSSRDNSNQPYSWMDEETPVTQRESNEPAGPIENEYTGACTVTNESEKAQQYSEWEDQPSHSSPPAMSTSTPRVEFAPIISTTPPLPEVPLPYIAPAVPETTNLNHFESTTPCSSPQDGREATPRDDQINDQLSSTTPLESVSPSSDQDPPQRFKNTIDLPLASQDYLSAREFHPIREVIYESGAWCRLTITPQCLRFLAIGTEQEVSLAMVLISIKLEESLSSPIP